MPSELDAIRQKHRNRYLFLKQGIQKVLLQLWFLLGPLLLPVLILDVPGNDFWFATVHRHAQEAEAPPLTS